ncbi:Putative transposase of IS4/5 family [Roseomonas rosea]|uniref:Putative transposase of IS4/5 family n=1 Tax=Muricoccus roseus TaxID=198092 RepID=A0A1M6FGF0_9PROT|nr:IS5/IS1182 family transposase [Roseomonas rosea]SHI96755.1 Putative transposase of IS4/5 family [Roseomonas rosea]
MSRLTPPRPHTPLTDLQWHALAPYVLPRSPQGRRTADLRARMNAIFHLAHTPGEPWKNLPAHYGNAQSVARFFRRLTHAGLWHRLLEALPALAPTHPLRQLEYAICRATRRAARIGGMPLLLLIRKLGLHTALNGPPWLLPNPLLSEMLARLPPPRLAPTRAAIAAARQHFKSLAWLARAALGRKSIPRVVRYGWP